ncbi:hypothetical protein [Xanthomonas euvesicatoria]|uniref:hypothetical protein n=1 Tax=Xanthomonas euvesicatoria TaxID=456327 RepID=UPI001E4CDF6F|nr:hypothetical protein [Xanthomonas euvesicatoria]
MRPTKVAMFSVAILCVTSLCACAHTLVKPTSPLPKKPRAMTTPDTSMVNPTLSAVEIGERFLKLLGGLDSRKDLTVDRVREVTGISLKKVSFPSEALESYIHGQALSNGWSYLLELTPESRALKQALVCLLSTRMKDLQVFKITASILRNTKVRLLSWDLWIRPCMVRSANYKAGGLLISRKTEAETIL